MDTPAVPINIEELLQSLTDSDENVRILAAFQLGALGDDAQAAIPALAELLVSDNMVNRRLAALALGKIGEPAYEAVPLLVNALEEEDEILRQFAVEALLLIEPQLEENEAA